MVFELAEKVYQNVHWEVHNKMITKRHLVYVVVALVMVVIIQSMFHKCTEKKYAKEGLENIIKIYEGNQRSRDSIISAKLDSMSTRDWKIKEYFYTTQKVIEQDYEELQTKNDSSLIDILNTLIEERKRSSKFRERQSN